SPIVTSDFSLAETNPVRKKNFLLVSVVGVVFAGLGVALWWRPAPEIHVLHDGPIIVARTLSAREVKQIQRLVRQAKQDSDVRGLRRGGLSAVRSVLNRHLFERIYDIEIERDGSVTVLTRNHRERPPRI